MVTVQFMPTPPSLIDRWILTTWQSNPWCFSGTDGSQLESWLPCRKDLSREGSSLAPFSEEKICRGGTGMRRPSQGVDKLIPRRWDIFNRDERHHLSPFDLQSSLFYPNWFLIVLMLHIILIIIIVLAIESLHSFSKYFHMIVTNLNHLQVGEHTVEELKDINNQLYKFALKNILKTWKYNFLISC